MRSTVHLLVADDALMLRQFTRPIHERERKVSQMVRAAIDVDLGEFAVAVRAALADGPLPVKRLGEVLTATFPDVPANALAHLARVAEPLAQLPPRGCWKQPGGVVYQYVDTWLGRPIVEPDPAAIVRRYLAAYGPASAADVTSWSGVPGMPAVLAAMDDLVPTPTRRARSCSTYRPACWSPRTRPRRCVSSACTTTSGSPRRPRPRHPPRQAQALDGRQRRPLLDGVRRRLARRAVAGRGRQAVVVELFRTLTTPEKSAARRGADRVVGPAGPLTWGRGLTQRVRGSSGRSIRTGEHQEVTMELQRRTALKGGVAAVAGALTGGPFAGLLAPAGAAAPQAPHPARTDPRPARRTAVRLHLPEGFSYRSFHDTEFPVVLDDGTNLPGRHDGMGAFAGRRRQHPPGPQPRDHQPATATAFGPGTPYDAKAGAGCTTIEVTKYGEVVNS